MIFSTGTCKKNLHMWIIGKLHGNTLGITDAQPQQSAIIYLGEYSMSGGLGGFREECKIQDAFALSCC